MHRESGLPIGAPVEDWTARPRPAPDLILEGRTCRLEPLDGKRHAEELHAALSSAPDDRLWLYMPQGPFADPAAYRAWVDDVAHRDDPFFLAVIDRASGHATGVASYLRTSPEQGTIEVGWITFSPLLQGTVAATEAMALMMRHVFDDLGYRRYEWKCNALNAASLRAAERLGFTFEGVHRQAQVVKGRNRDTAWFSILDVEWPPIRAALEAWLDPANFDEHGRQRTRLAIISGAGS